MRQQKLWTQTLADKIQARSARAGIVGLGYVGLPPAMEFAKAGFSVSGSMGWVTKVMSQRARSGEIIVVKQKK